MTTVEFAPFEMPIIRQALDEYCHKRKTEQIEAWHEWVIAQSIRSKLG